MGGGPEVRRHRKDAASRLKVREAMNNVVLTEVSGENVSAV